MDGRLALAFLEQLRDWQDFEPAKQFCPEMIKDVLLAAAEIERLRAVLQGIAEYCSGDGRPLGAIERLAHIRNTADQALRHSNHQ